MTCFSHEIVINNDESVDADCVHIRKRKYTTIRVNYNSKQLDCQTVRPAQSLN